MAEKLPEWNAVGVEPPQSLKDSGWQPGMKPSAQHMNWLLNRAYKCIEELQQAGGNVDDLTQAVASLEQTVGTHLNDNLSHTKWIETIGGTANALTATIDGLTSYKNGLAVSFPATSNSTAAMTLNINGLGAIPIKKANGTAFSNAKANGVYTIRYRAGAFILQGEGGEYGDVTTNDVRKGKIFGTVDGLKTGTLDLSNLKPENLRRGVTIDGVAGGIDKAHGVLVKPEDITKAGKVRENFQQCYFTIDDNEYYEAKSTGTTHVVNKYNAAGALIKTVPIAGYTGEAYYVEIPRYGEVQFMRQYHMIGAFDWDTGVLKDIVYTSNFGEPKAAIQYNPKNSYDRLIIGNVGTHTYTGVYNRSNVLLDGLSWLEVIDGYGMTRQMSDTAWIVTGRGAGGLLTVLSPDSQGIDMNYFNTTENASSTLQRVCGCLLTYGRKI
ncbi:hypothetical protein ACP3VS_18250 [Lysinibacillus sp. VIII_CA]|uniref:hypothetical protein n=1 Tax=Lysinibacillus sp. VIII_CA TaxID=3417452 RepID=UPI003CF90703